MISVLEAEQRTNAGRSLPTTPPLQSCNSDFVLDGFSFPCGKLAQLEHLEVAVIESRTVREQFVNYLRVSRNECHNDIAKVLKRIFEDDAFVGYCYSTDGHPATSFESSGPNLANYAIFNSCMLEAWPDMTKDTLREELSVIIPDAAMLQKEPTDSILEVELYNDTIVEASSTLPPYGYSSDYEYDCLLFPCNSSKQVALLEESVKASADVRKQYVNYLRASRFECKNNLEKILRRMFDEKAFMNYSYTRFPKQTSWPNLLNYCIFNNCMLDAWSDMTDDSLTKALSELVPKMRKSAYRREHRVLKGARK